MIDAEGVVPRARESAIGMALVDAQLVAAMRRTINSKAVTFSVRTASRAARANSRPFEMPPRGMASTSGLSRG